MGIRMRPRAPSGERNRLEGPQKFVRQSKVNRLTDAAAARMPRIRHRWLAARPSPPFQRGPIKSPLRGTERVCSWTTTGTAKVRRFGGRNAAWRRSATGGRDGALEPPYPGGGRLAFPSPASTLRDAGAAATANGRLGGIEGTAPRGGGGGGKGRERERERGGGEEEMRWSPRRARPRAARRRGRACPSPTRRGSAPTSAPLTGCSAPLSPVCAAPRQCVRPSVRSVCIAQGGKGQL